MSNGVFLCNDAFLGPVNDQNYLTDLNQILYSDKYHQGHFVGGPAHAYNKSQMADDRHIGNQKFAISMQLFNQSRRNFAQTC